MTEHDRVQQLAALLEGEDLPAVPSSLGALAELATTVRDHAELMAPTPAFRSSLRAELVAAAEAPPGLVERARSAWTARTAGLRASARVAIATMTASSMIGSAGVAVAAQEALPGQSLYGVKSLTEDARLALATDDVAEARLHLTFARERLQELRATAGRLDTDEVIALLAEMDAHSEAGAEAMLTGVGTGTADADEVRRFTTDQRDGLVGVIDDLPLLAKPVAEDSLELLRRIEVTATGTTPAVADCDCDRGPHPDDAADGTGPTDAAATTTQPLPATDASAIDVTLPGEQPAIPLPDCDCIELPGGSEAREERPTTRDDVEDAGTEAPPGEPTADPEESQQEPENPLENDLATPGDADEEKRHDAVVDAPTAVEELPTHDVADALETTIDADLDPPSDEALQDNGEDLLSD